VSEATEEVSEGVVVSVGGVELMGWSRVTRFESALVLREHQVVAGG